MSKKLPITPNTRVRQALRQLWLRSRERGKKGFTFTPDKPRRKHK